MLSELRNIVHRLGVGLALDMSTVPMYEHRREINANWSIWEIREFVMEQLNDTIFR